MAFKDFATKGGSLLLVPYDKIVDNPRNVREDYGDISDLANDINQNGLKLPLIIQRNQRNDEAAVLVDGHRRIRAIKYAVEKLGSPIKQVECKFEAEGTNEGDRLISMFSTGMNTALRQIMASLNQSLIDRFGDSFECFSCLRRLNFGYRFTKKTLQPVVF
jgi:hypothetical protein